MNLLNPQEAPGEADDPRAGDQPEGVGHPRRRVLVAQVRAEAHQGIAIESSEKQRERVRKEATDRERKSSLLMALLANVESRWTKTSLVCAEGVFVLGFRRLRL